MKQAPGQTYYQKVENLEIQNLVTEYSDVSQVEARLPISNMAQFAAQTNRIWGFWNYL